MPGFNALRWRIAKTLISGHRMATICAASSRLRISGAAGARRVGGDADHQARVGGAAEQRAARAVELDADHQALAAHLDDAGDAGELALEPGLEHRADLGGVGEQAFFFHDPQASRRRRASPAGCRRRSCRGCRRRRRRRRAGRRRRRRSARPSRGPWRAASRRGWMPAHWCANHLPVRPMPHCTSSSMSSQPRSSQMRRTCFRYSMVVGRMPPSPWITSRKTATTLGCVAATFSTAPTSLSGTPDEALDQRAEAGLDLGVAGGRQRRDRAAVERRSRRRRSRAARCPCRGRTCARS